MKRIFKLALLAMLMCLTLMLTGCHGSPERTAFQLPAAFDESRQFEITFWAKNDTNLTQADLYRKAIEDFEALYPNVTVKLRLYTDYGRIYNDVITNIATGTTPNVCITYPDHIATYLTGEECVVALDSLMDDARYGLGGSEVRFDAPTRSEIIPQFLQECAFDGATYALPYMRSTEACYVNKTFVEKLGFTLPDQLTWDFVWQVADAAAGKNADGVYPVNGQKIMIPFIYKSTDNMMIQMLRQRGAGYSEKSGRIHIFNDVTRELLKEVAAHVKKGAFSTFKISSYPANFLNAGQCIFAVDSTAGSTWMGSEAPLIDIAEDKIVPFETRVMMLPQFDPANPQMISQGPSMCIFNKEDPQEVLASWLFMQFLLTNDIQIAYASTEGYVPVTSKAQQSAAYQDYLSRAGEDGDHHYVVKMEATQLLLDHVDDTFVTPVFNGSASLRDAAGQMIEEVTKSTRRKKTVDDAFIDDLFADMISLYRLNPEGTRDTLVTEDDLGPLPATSVMLLGAIGGAWVLIGLYVLREQLHSRKRQKNKASC